jgi:hypothetical protein
MVDAVDGDHSGLVSRTPVGRSGGPGWLPVKTGGEVCQVRSGQWRAAAAFRVGGRGVELFESAGRMQGEEPGSVAPPTRRSVSRESRRAAGTSLAQQSNRADFNTHSVSFRTAHPR